MVPTWSEKTNLLTLSITLRCDRDGYLPNQYTTALHGWFLDQMRGVDPSLSQYLHDEQMEKAFTLSPIFGLVQERDLRWRMAAGQLYQFRVSGLSERVCQGFVQWVSAPPKQLSIARQSFAILKFEVEGATTYQALWDEMEDGEDELALRFVTATSFRKRGNHMPLPIPENVFHSYLRRWNVFGPIEFEGDHFLNWVNDCVVILRHEIRSLKVQAGKRGSVTGFVGSVQFGFVGKAGEEPEYVQLVKTLVNCAPFLGTGHKGTFGLGQTRKGWNKEEGGTLNAERGIVKPAIVEQAIVKQNSIQEKNVQETILEEKRELGYGELRGIFLGLKKRQGGERGIRAAELWALILVRQGRGEMVKTIAADLGMNYETVKRYAKLARRALEDYQGEK